MINLIALDNYIDLINSSPVEEYLVNIQSAPVTGENMATDNSADNQNIRTLSAPPQSLSAAPLGQSAPPLKNIQAYTA